MDDQEWDEHYAEMHTGNMGGFVAGLLIGALAGAATMLLMAPQSGEETRRQLGEKTFELKERVAEKADDVRGRVEHMQQRGQAMLEEQRTRVNDAVEAGKQSMRRRSTG
jgi:gas vesicle protein